MYINGQKITFINGKLCWEIPGFKSEIHHIELTDNEHMMYFTILDLENRISVLKTQLANSISRY